MYTYLLSWAYLFLKETVAKDEANEVLLVIVGVEVLWSPEKSSSPESRSEEFELAVTTVHQSLGLGRANGSDLEGDRTWISNLGVLNILIKVMVNICAQFLCQTETKFTFGGL